MLWSYAVDFAPYSACTAESNAFVAALVQRVPGRNGLLFEFAAIYGTDAAIYATNTAIDGTKAAIFCANVAIFGTKSAVFSTKAAISSTEAAAIFGTETDKGGAGGQFPRSAPRGALVQR